LTNKRIDTTRQAQIELFCGSSGSGKSYKVKSKIKNASRLVIFDPDDEYTEIKGVQTVRTAQTLISLVQRNPKGALKVRYVANGDAAFNVWAKAVFAWGNCVCVAEEIAGVTSPGKAPTGWHTLVSRGRKRGITIYAVTQRPSESDKTILGNISRIWVGRMARDKDRKYMAAELDVNKDDITELQALDYLERDMLTNTVVRGNSRAKWQKTLSQYKLDKSKTV
jgi:hypothetical protein